MRKDDQKEKETRNMDATAILINICILWEK